MSAEPVATKLRPPTYRPVGALEPRVRNERVFRGRYLPAYALLSVVNIAVTGWLVAFWLGRFEWSWQTPAYLVLTGLLLSALLLFELRWFALPLMRRPRHMPASPGWGVGVATTFVPGAEDIGMLERTVRTLVAMDYPHDTWVLDEGDDPDVRDLCERVGARHFSRSGIVRYQQPRGRFEACTKHGNYNAWLDAVGYERYDIVTAFDPDHVPRSCFLTRILGYFDDPAVGYVQAPQIYYNQRASFVARGAAEETYAYYSSIQMCSHAMGYPILTGCHNSHRVRALRQVGGFADHEADDLLITIRYRVAAWRGVYVPERLAAGLTPVDMFGYLNQQRRWARSVLDIKLRVLSRLSGALPLRERVTSFVHGLYYLQGLGTALAVALLSFMLIAGRTPAVFAVGTGRRMLVTFAIVRLSDIFRQVFFLQPKREWGLHWRAGILRMVKWPYVLLALGDVLTRANRGYTLTRKVRSARRRFAAMPAHLLVAGIVGTAWAIGAARGVSGAALTAIASVVIGLSLLCALTEIRRFPPPYDEQLAASELADT